MGIEFRKLLRFAAGAAFLAMTTVVVPIAASDARGATASGSSRPSPPSVSSAPRSSPAPTVSAPRAEAPASVSGSLRPSAPATVVERPAIIVERPAATVPTASGSLRPTQPDTSTSFGNIAPQRDTSPRTVSGSLRPGVPGSADKPSTTALAPSTPSPVLTGMERSAALAGSGSALQRLRQEQSAQNRPAATPPAVAEARTNPFLSTAATPTGSSPSRWNNADNYLADRDRSYSRYRDQINSDPWARNAYEHSRSSYGTWDTVLLTGLLTHTADSAYYNWAYSHRDDSGYRQWHDDQMRLANDNADLKAKLDELDDHVRAMERDGVKAQPASDLPPGVDPAVAVAPAAVLAASEARSPTFSSAANPIGAASASAPAMSAKHQGGHGFGFYLLVVFGITVLGGVVFVIIMIRCGKSR